MSDLIKVSEPLSRRARGLLYMLLPPVVAVGLFLLAIFLVVCDSIIAPEVAFGQGMFLGNEMLRAGFPIVTWTAILFTLIGFPSGIYLLATAEKSFTGAYDTRSGAGSRSEVPREILGWNWGAAGLTWIWGLGNGVWASLLIFFPVINLVFWVFLGVYGSEWAWRARKWESVEKFQDAQREWRPWGIIFLVMAFLIFFILIMVVVVRPNTRSDVEALDTSSLISSSAQVSGIETLEGLKVPYRISFDRSKWGFIDNAKHINAVTEYEFMHRDGDIFAMLIAERLGNAKDMSVKVLEHARQLDPDAQLISEDVKELGGKDFVVLKIDLIISGVPYFYYGNFYSGDEGTVQYVVACPQNLFDRYSEDITELLDSLTL